MAHKTRVNGTNYGITGGKCMINGTNYSIKKGRTLIGGTGYDISFRNTAKLSSLPVGTSVYANVNGVPYEFIIVHQGKPSSAYYGSNMGAWLLMKNTYSKVSWNSSSSNNYGSSYIKSWLNGSNTFLGLFDDAVENKIITVRIPYTKGTGSSGSVASGSSGLSTRVFLLSATEVGINASDYFLNVEGVKLSYFTSANSSRIAYNSKGYKTNWALRSPYTDDDTSITQIADYGTMFSGGFSSTGQYEMRPAFVMHSSTLVDLDDYSIVG